MPPRLGTLQGTGTVPTFTSVISQKSLYLVTEKSKTVQKLLENDSKDLSQGFFPRSICFFWTCTCNSLPLAAAQHDDFSFYKATQHRLLGLQLSFQATAMTQTASHRWDNMVQFLSVLVFCSGFVLCSLLQLCSCSNGSRRHKEEKIAVAGARPYPDLLVCLPHYFGRQVDSKNESMPWDWKASVSFSCLDQQMANVEGENQSERQSREETLNKAIWQMYEGEEKDETKFCFKYLLTTKRKLLGTHAMGEQTFTL